MIGKSMQSGYVAMLLSVLVHSALLGWPISWKKLSKSPPPNVASVPVIRLMPTPASAPPKRSPVLSRERMQRRPEQSRRINLPKPLRQPPPQPRLPQLRRPLVLPPAASPTIKPTPIVQPRMTRSSSPAPTPSPRSSTIAAPTLMPNPTPTLTPTPNPTVTPTPIPNPTEVAPSPAEIAQSFQTVVDSFKASEGLGTYSLAEILLFFGQETQSKLLLTPQEQPQPEIMSYQVFSDKAVAQVRDEQLQPKLKEQQFTLDQLMLIDDAPTAAGEVWHMQRQEFQRYLQIMPLNDRSGTLLVIWARKPPFAAAPATPAKN